MRTLFGPPSWVRNLKRTVVRLGGPGKLPREEDLLRDIGPWLGKLVADEAIVFGPTDRIWHEAWRHRGRVGRYEPGNVLRCANEMGGEVWFGLALSQGEWCSHAWVVTVNETVESMPLRREWYVGVPITEDRMSLWWPFSAKQNEPENQVL